jgi:hypothetical protein
MEDPNRLRVYKLFLKPIPAAEGQIDVQISAYDTGELKGREVDHHGEITTPNQGDIISRNGKRWKAVHIITQVSSDGSVPVVRVFLTDQLVP